jgi:hypothetical protein
MEAGVADHVLTLDDLILVVKRLQLGSDASDEPFDPTAMEMGGHKTEAIYRRYALVDSPMMREAAEKLSAFHDGQQQITAAPSVVKMGAK